MLTCAATGGFIFSNRFDFASANPSRDRRRDGLDPEERSGFVGWEAQADRSVIRTRWRADCREPAIISR